MSAGLNGRGAPRSSGATEPRREGCMVMHQVPRGGCTTNGAPADATVGTTADATTSTLSTMS
eukprot:1843330-Alexandrium_andersonii.AAC.1